MVLFLLEYPAMKIPMKYPMKGNTLTIQIGTSRSSKMTSPIEFAKKLAAARSWLYSLSTKVSLLAIAANRALKKRRRAKIVNNTVKNIGAC